MVGVEVGEHLCEPERVAGGRGDPNDPALHARVLVERGARLRDLAEDRLGVLEEVGAGRRQLDALRRARQQRETELGLEPRTCCDSAGWVT